MSPLHLNRRSIILNGKTYNIYCEDSNVHYFTAASEDYDYQLLTLINNCLPKDGICLDIGANIGFVTALLHSRLAAGRGFIYAMEPARNNYAALSTMVSDNKMANVIPLNMACSSEPGIVRFFENNRWGHLDDSSDYKVACISIDFLLRNRPVDRLDLIKIDVEGNEWNVLRGGMESINKFQPVIYMEYNTLCLLANTEENPKFFLRWLFDHFRHVGIISKKARTRENLVKRYRKDQENAILFRNIIEEGSVSNFVLTNNDQIADKIYS